MQITDKITITNEDNMELMARYTDGYFDLAIVDPEYGININNNIGRRKGDKHSGHKKVHWDSKPPEDSYFDELLRISKNQIIWGGNYFIQLWKKGCKGFIIWDKKFSNEVSFSKYEFAWTSFDVSSKGFEYSPQQDKDKIHPTQKPIKLYKWLLDMYAKPGDKILDTHLGSGSIAIACFDFGFELTACELDKDYYDAAVKRIQHHIAFNQSLFQPEELTQTLF
ncbi:DNA methyltransferase [Elizabethkingia anophelis]|uniref:DNA methyltransferase n=1 Tax=Elizabethkingia anophelis TaxID=1117645 RepID=UPI00389146CB